MIEDNATGSNPCSDALCEDGDMSSPGVRVTRMSLRKVGLYSVLALGLHSSLASLCFAEPANRRSLAEEEVRAPCEERLEQCLTTEQRRLYAKAKSHFSRKRYAKAEKLFMQLAERTEYWKIAWNLASTQIQLQKYVEAAAVLEELINEAPLPKQDRELARQTLLSLDEHLFVWDPQIEPDGTSVVVDGLLRGTTPLATAIRLRKGRPYRILLLRDGFKPVNVDVTGPQFLKRVELEPESELGGRTPETPSVSEGAIVLMPTDQQIADSMPPVTTPLKAAQDFESAGSTTWAWWVAGGALLLVGAVGTLWWLGQDDAPKQEDVITIP
jgi:hypothetical protein